MWTIWQIKRAETLFILYLTFEKAYNLAQAMGYIFDNNKNRGAIRLRPTHEYDKVRKSQFKSFRTKARYLQFLHYFQ